MRLSLNGLAGKRSDEDDSSLCSVNRSELGNLPDESPNLLDESPAPSFDCGQRDSGVDPVADAAARDSKSVPAPEADAAPALSSKLAPNELAPQVLEPPPRSSDPIEEGPKLVPVPIEPPEVPTPAVVVAYSPIVWASACGANSASIAISTGGTIDLMSLMAFELP